jgi:predicted dehydrogenase
MPDKTIRAAILGTGLSLTAFHHPLLKALPELFTVHSVLERSGKETCRSIVGDDVKIVTTYEEVIGDADVDLVVVSTPNRTHFDYVKRALEAGKHGELSFFRPIFLSLRCSTDCSVMCEKPLTPTSKEAEELFKIAQANNRILGVYQNRRWDGDFLTIQKLIKDGTVGHLRVNHVVFADQISWDLSWT